MVSWFSPKPPTSSTNAATTTMPATTGACFGATRKSAAIGKRLRPSCRKRTGAIFHFRRSRATSYRDTRYERATSHHRRDRPDRLAFTAHPGTVRRRDSPHARSIGSVSYTHLRAHETVLDLVC